MVGTLEQKTKTVVSQSRLDNMLGIKPRESHRLRRRLPALMSPRLLRLRKKSGSHKSRANVIRKLENQPKRLPSVAYLTKPEIQARVVREVAAQYRPPQLELEGVTKPPDIAAVVAKTTELVIQQTIDIPRILVVPKGEVRSGFKPSRWNWQRSTISRLRRNFGSSISARAERK